MATIDELREMLQECELALRLSEHKIYGLEGELFIIKRGLERITQAYEADVYSLSDAIMIAEKLLDDIDKFEKGVTI